MVSGVSFTLKLCFVCGGAGLRLGMMVDHTTYCHHLQMQSNLFEHVFSVYILSHIYI